METALSCSSFLVRELLGPGCGRGSGCGFGAVGGEGTLQSKAELQNPQHGNVFSWNQAKTETLTMFSTL